MSFLLASSLTAMAVTTPYPAPVMSPFYIECMKAGGTPGTEWRDEFAKIYDGPEYMFRIWTPYVDNEAQLTLEVQYRNRYEPGNPAPLKYIVRNLRPGGAVVFASDEVYLSRDPRTGNSRASQMEYCIQISPVIDLKGLGLPEGIEIEKP